MMCVHKADATSAAGRMASAVTTTRELQGREEDGATSRTYSVYSDDMAKSRYILPPWRKAYEWVSWAGRRLQSMTVQWPYIVAPEFEAMLFASPLSRLITLMPLLQIASSGPFSGHGNTQSCNRQPPVFFLAGDSTTAVQSSDGGGWGVGFLSTLKSPAWGIDYGQNGATTVSFVAGGNWSDVIDSVRNSMTDYNALVTIQVYRESGPRQRPRR